MNRHTLLVEHREVRVPVRGGVAVNGTFVRPRDAVGLVIFAHGSGSSRRSPRNRFVAEDLQRKGFGTLLMDLLLPEEEEREECRFDIALLAERLAAAASWAAREAGDLPFGYFGASTGAAAALVADARQPGQARALVSRGGRPDLAEGFLEGVRAPTLLIVGGDDGDVLTLNRQAARRLRTEHRIAVVPGATHLFEEPGALEEVSRLSGEWFSRFLRSAVVEKPARR